MTDNTIKSGDTEVYEHDIYYYADEYIQDELDGDRERVPKCFAGMIYYIADRIQKPDNDNIELLDSIFKVYVRLCSKYAVLPTLEVFSFLVKIDRNTFTDWRFERYRVNTGHSSTAKKWFDTCKAFTVDRLHNKPGVDANLIFIAKAAYGMRETAPEPVENKTIERRISREELGLEPPTEIPQLPGTGENP